MKFKFLRRWGGGYLNNKKITPKKSLVIGITLGILVGGIGVAAATYFSASEVSYTPKDTSWNVSDVKGALDDLYSNIGGINENIGIVKYQASKVLPGETSTFTFPSTGTYTLFVNSANGWDGEKLGISSSSGITYEMLEEYHSSTTRTSSEYSYMILKVNVQYDNASISFVHGATNGTVLCATYVLIDSESEILKYQASKVSDTKTSTFTFPSTGTYTLFVNSANGWDGEKLGISSSSGITYEMLEEYHSSTTRTSSEYSYMILRVTVKESGGNINFIHGASGLCSTYIMIK